MADDRPRGGQHGLPNMYYRRDQKPSEAIKGHQGASEAIKAHQGPSEAIRGQSEANQMTVAEMPGCSSACWNLRRWQGETASVIQHPSYSPPRCLIKLQVKHRIGVGLVPGSEDSIPIASSQLSHSCLGLQAFTPVSSNDTTKVVTSSWPTAVIEGGRGS
eukprot:CAMPEP_0181246484 /NCGR_PEP_ID=MMETSP1096-20121128/44025_1 /TAXON_ID=156174 ORGANISM="Chrysochromulina ericina, Strain CCMP281" /NCGR_SAMPLE_ID=MMETSP1096 /ASSEMBLY_ACC=CAM_ASM_000453 /LENGTH=159 /DNA_ID=CAMNT_0023343317 /DNA_START=65 /DNA_END=544 /DNA_ORIENTATION=-